MVLSSSGMKSSEGSVSVLPPIARRNRREHVPMLRNLSILHSEKIIVCGGWLGTRFGQSEHEIAFRHIAARHEDRRRAGLRHPRNPRFHARNPVTNFGGMLRVMITVDEFIDTIKTQLDRHYLLEGANESSIFLSSVRSRSTTAVGPSTWVWPDGLGPTSGSCPPQCSAIFPLLKRNRSKAMTGPAKPRTPSYFEWSMTMSPSTRVR